MKTPGIFTRKEPYDERAYMTIGEKYVEESRFHWELN